MYQERIRELYDTLSPSYQRIAGFLLSNYREAAFMTATQVARATQSDAASVVRLAQRLGYSGYPELIAAVQEEVKRDLRKVYEPGPEEQTPAALFRRALLEDRNNLEYALLHLDTQGVEAAISALEKARHIFVVAEGTALGLATSFALRLQAFGVSISILPGDSAGRAALSALFRPEDVFLGLSNSSITPGVAVTLRIAREGGAHTIAIVGSLTNSAARAAELVLHAPADALGILHPWTASAAVLHALSQVMIADMGDRAARWVINLEHLLKRFNEVWEQPITALDEVLDEHAAMNRSRGGDPQPGMGQA